MKYLCWCLLIAFAWQPCFGQNEAAIKARLDSVRALRKHNPAQAEALAIKCVTESEAIDYNYGLVSACDLLGTLNRSRDQRHKALQWYQRALSHVDSSDWPSAFASGHNNMGVCYDELGDYALAISHYIRALRYWESEEDWASVAGVSRNIASLYVSLGDHQMGIEMYERSLSASEKINDRAGLTKTCAKMSRTYRLMGNDAKSAEYRTLSLTYAQEAGQAPNNATEWLDKGHLAHKKRDYEGAVAAYEKAVALERSGGGKLGLANALLALGRSETELEHWNKAVEPLSEAHDIGKEIGNPHITLQAFKMLSIVYSRAEDWKHAYMATTYAYQVNEEIFNEGNSTIINDLRTRYESERKEAENELLKRDQRIQAQNLELQQYRLQEQLERNDTLQAQNDEQAVVLTAQQATLKLQEQEIELKEQRLANANQALAIEEQASELKDLKLNRANNILFGLIILALLLVVVGWLFLRQQKLRSAQRTAKLEQRLLRSQMNPHFIFNALVAIQSFLYTNNAAAAGIYLSKFAKLMRNILESSSEEFVPLEKEVKTLEHYLELQRLRFEEKFDYTIEVDEDLDLEDVTLPPMLAQPFIENAIEHGLRHKGAQGHITVRFSKDDDEAVLFTVEDDGIGRQKAAAINAQERGGHRSFAMKITEDRLNHLNRKHKGSLLAFEVADVTGPDNHVGGTRVSFSLPPREAA